jgi:hypothetical protein
MQRNGECEMQYDACQRSSFSNFKLIGREKSPLVREGSPLVRATVLGFWILSITLYSKRNSTLFWKLDNVLSPETKQAMYNIQSSEPVRTDFCCSSNTRPTD